MEGVPFNLDVAADCSVSRWRLRRLAAFCSTWDRETAGSVPLRCTILVTQVAKELSAAAKLLVRAILARLCGGRCGIRTHGDPKATTVFETAPFVRSGNLPQRTLSTPARLTASPAAPATRQ